MTRTLLVDDAPVLRQLVRMVLEADGSFQVVAEAGDGLEAIEAAREHQPELILLDLSMPRMGGLEALPHLREAAPGARVAVFTGFVDAEVTAKARAAGASRVLHKGLDPHALCDELLALAGQGTQPNEPPGPSRSAGRDRRTSRPRPGALLDRAPRRRIPAPVLVVLVVALLLALYGAMVGFAAPDLPDPHYVGGFEEASFREPDLAATPASLLDGSSDGYSVVVPSLSLRWSVDADGGVTMTGGGSWPEAREAFARWYEARGFGSPAFADLRITGPDGAVLDDPAVLLV